MIFAESEAFLGTVLVYHRREHRLSQPVLAYRFNTVAITSSIRGPELSPGLHCAQNTIFPWYSESISLYTAEGINHMKF